LKAVFGCGYQARGCPDDEVDVYRYAVDFKVEDLKADREILLVAVSIRGRALGRCRRGFESGSRDRFGCSVQWWSSFKYAAAHLEREVQEWFRSH